MTLPVLTGTPPAWDAAVMVLLFCDGVVYTAGELNFLFKIGWLPVDALLRCGVAWLT